MRMRLTTAVLIVTGLLVLSVSVFVSPGVQTYLVYAYEDVSLFLDPSAERAYAYGKHHLDRAKAGEYDIDRADYLFKKTLRYEPHTLHARHQLARIAFLRGDFRDALRFIDREIETFGPDASFSSYYVQGLILGFMGYFEESAQSYEKYLAHDPYNWAALNDYAWVLLRAEDAEGARDATNRGLLRFPDNPWLLNTNAIARYELGDMSGAREKAHAAAKNAISLSENDWLVAYPGNDPLIAAAGVLALQESIAANLHAINKGDPASELQP